MASDFNNLQLVITEVDGSVIAEITVSQNDTFSAVGRYRQHPWKILIQTGTEQNCINGLIYCSTWSELLPNNSVVITTINVLLMRRN